MKTNNWEIKIGKGLEDINFGMSRSDIRKILGDPEDIEQYEYVEGSSEIAESWHYDDEEISLTFFEENADWQLETIAVSSANYVFMGVKLIGASKADLVKHLDKMNIEYDVEEFPEEPGQVLVNLREENVLIWLDNDEVHEIQWEPIWAD